MSWSLLIIGITFAPSGAVAAAVVVVGGGVVGTDVSSAIGFGVRVLS